MWFQDDELCKFKRQYCEIFFMAECHVAMKMIRLANLEGYGSWNSLCGNDTVAQYKIGKFNYILFIISSTSLIYLDYYRIIDISFLNVIRKSVSD